MVTAARRIAAAPTRAAAPSRPAPRSAAPARRALAAPSGSSGYRGAAGYQKMQEEEARSEAAKEASAQMAGMPFRFYCPSGETREVIVVDDQPDFFRHEHNLQNPRSNKYDIFTACINENENCPVCRATNRQPYFAMYLTIIDLTPYVNRQNEEVPWSKKLLVVKPAQQKKIMRKLESHGSLRGMVLQLTRDGDKDASIGNDIEVVEILDEDALAEYYTTYIDTKNVEHEVIGNEVFDYEALFPAVTAEQLIAVSQGRADIGSRESDRQGNRPAVRGPRGGGDDWRDDPPARRMAPGRRTGGDVQDVEPRVPTRRAAVPPAGRVPLAPRRAAAPEPQDDAPPARAPAGRAPLAPRRAVAPAAREVEQDDVPQRAAPARRGVPAPAAAPRDAASLADARRALRRG